LEPDWQYTPLPGPHAVATGTVTNSPNNIPAWSGLLIVITPSKSKCSAASGEHLLFKLKHAFSRYFFKA
jgi:hypothetical protein